MSRDQCVFFPWHRNTPESRLPAGGVNVDVVQQMAMQFLQAGKDYDRAYRAAFANERMERALPVTVPATIMRWQGSILKPYTDRFDSVEWPGNFTMLHCGPSREQRVAAFRSIFTERLPQSRGKDFRIPRPDNSGVAGKGFLDLDAGAMPLPVRRGAKTAPPAGPARRRQLATFPGRAGGCPVRPISRCRPRPAGPTAYRTCRNRPSAVLSVPSTILAELVGVLRWSRFRVLAEKGSAALAVALAERLGAPVEAVQLVNPVDYAALAGGMGTWKALPWFQARTRKARIS